MECVNISHPQLKPDFESWWKTVERSVLLTASSKVRIFSLHGFGAADIAQEVALGAYFVWRKIENTPGEELSRESKVNFFPNAKRSAAWVRRRAHWIYLDKLKLVRPEVSLEQMEGVDIVSHTTPSSEAEQYELLELISKLPPEQQEVMNLAAKGFTSDEIGSKIGKQSNSVRSLLRHARYKMLKLMEQYEDKTP